MRVAFLHARQDPACALLMLESVRRHGIDDIIQLTDETDPALPGCAVQRLPWDGTGVMEFRLRHLAALPDQDLLLIDTDVLIQADVRAVFSFPFDIGLTRRDGPIFDAEGNDITVVMRYNGGVVFSRRQAFWQQCHAWIEEQDAGLQDWYGDQVALAKFSPQWNALLLHCDNFNYTPLDRDEDVSGRLLVHYKGRRKEWMKERACALSS